MKSPNKICINCALRHNICGYDYMTESCEYFEIGKCFICANKNNKELCQAEDMSGYGCNNFVDSKNFISELKEQ